MNMILIFLTALFTSLLTVAGVRKLALHYQIGALPSARKIHTAFVPVMGGLGIAAGLLAAMLLAGLTGLLPGEAWMTHRYFWFGLLVILVTGLIDDIRGLAPYQKFAGEFIAAGAAVLGGCYIEAFYSPTGGNLALGWFSYPFSVLWLVFIINAVNLLDGLDGLAGGISLITIAGFLLLTIFNEQVYLMYLALAMAGAILGFLRYNYRPASIFMGDVGSLMLGYVLACFSVETLKIAGSQQVYFLASLILLGMPLTDTLISFFRRMGRGDHPFKPDREHIHHRLLKMGLSHIDSVWMMYYFTLLFVALGVLMVIYREFAGTLLFLIAFVFAIFWTWRLGYLETRRIISFGVNEQETAATMRPQIHVGSIWHKIAILAGDIIAINLAIYLTWWFKFQSGVINPLTIKSLQDYFTTPVWLVFTAGWLALFWLNGLYRMPWDVSRYDQILRVSKIISFGIFVILLLMNLDIMISSSDRSPFNPNQITTLAVYWGAMGGFVNLIRMMIIKIEKRWHLFEYTYKNTLIIGTTRRARNIIRDIEGNPHMLHCIVGIVDRKAKSPEFEGYPLLGDYEALPELIQKHKVEEIIIAINETAREDLLNIIGICDRLQVVVKTLPVLQTIVTGHSPEIAGYALVRAFSTQMVLWQWGIKRLIDLLFAVTGIVGGLLLWLPIAVLVKLRYGGSSIVKLPILGRNGRIFNMYLFRLGKDDELTRRLYQGSGDADALDRIGRFLYRTHLYKFSQLYNILRGDMSLVGPRPEPLEWYRRYQHQFRFLHRRVMVRPGITGMAQYKYRFDASQKMHQERLKFDIFYGENISLNLDLRIIIRSIFLFLRKSPA